MSTGWQWARAVENIFRYGCRVGQSRYLVPDTFFFPIPLSWYKCQDTAIFVACAQ